MGALYVVSEILMLVGGIWLVVAAFQESVFWGLMVLFVPFAGLVFVIKYWQKAKASFAVQVVGIALYVPSASSVMHNRLEHFRQLAAARQHDRAPSDDSGMPTNDNEVDMGPYTPSSGSDRGAPTPTTAPERNNRASPVPPPAMPVHHTAPRTGMIRLADAKNHIGELMRITSKKHVVRVAKLREVGSHVLVFEHDEHGGNITYRMRTTEIAHLESLGAGDM